MVWANCRVAPGLSSTEAWFRLTLSTAAPIVRAEEADLVLSLTLVAVIKTPPFAFAVTNPVLETVALLGSEVDHVTSLSALRRGKTAAVSCTVPFTAFMFGLWGKRFMEVRGGGGARGAGGEGGGERGAADSFFFPPLEMINADDNTRSVKCFIILKNF